MKRFLMIWIGEFISSIGSGMTAFALGVYAYQLTKSASAGALIALVSFLPMILLSTVGGVLADRLDRRMLMICGDFLSIFGLLYILICIQSGHITIWKICVGIAISAIFTSLIDPAYKAIVTDLLTQEEFAKASGLVQIASAAKFLISPFLAGILLNLTDIRVILIIDMCTFFVTVGILTLARKGLRCEHKPDKTFNFLRELSEGWKAICTKKGILLLVLLMTAVCFYMGFVQILMTPMILSFSDATTLGYMESIAATGMLVGSILIGIFNIKHSYTKVLANGLLTAGIFIIGMGMCANIWVIGVSAIIFFITLPFINTAADVLIRVSIPNEVQGRAWGIIGLISQLGYVLAYGVSGILADYVFNPMLLENGLLANSVGKVIGIGEGRGIGFMLILSGIAIAVVAVCLERFHILKGIEPKRENEPNIS